MAPATHAGFTLYGGTAIALRLGHRPSVDFDFFSSVPLDRAVVGAWFASCTAIETLQEDRNTWVFLVPVGEGRVKLSFFGGIGTGRVGEPSLTDDGRLLVASPIDLLGHKLKVILQRAESKDYRDIAALVRGGLSLVEGLGAATALFGSTYAASESLRALTFFEDGDLSSLDAETRKVLVAAARNVVSVPVVPLFARTL